MVVRGGLVVVCFRTGIVGWRYGSLRAGWLPLVVLRELRSGLCPFCFVAEALVLGGGERETHTRRVA